MKKLLIALVIGLIGYACSEEKVGVYSLERDYIYFQYESSRLGTTMNVADSVYLYYNSSSVSVNSSRQRDTFFFRVKVAGMARSVDRKINIEPYSFLTNGREEAIAGVNYVAFDDPENPTIMEDFIRALGAEPVIYPYRNECCGGYISLKEKDMSQNMCQKIEDSAKGFGADMLITACPLCKYNLNKNASSELPVYYFTELLAEALGVKEEVAK